jgi:hypothetical protein
MPTLPSIANQVDVAELVRTQTQFYQPEGDRVPGDPKTKDRPSLATPAAMLILLDALIAYTEDVQAKASESGLTGDTVMGQWQSDMSNWVARVNHYRDVVRSVDPKEANTLAGADAIFFTVTSPLLDGYFYENLPGLVLDAAEKTRLQQGPPDGVSNKKPPDLYVPFSLGNQVMVYREHQRQRWDQLWADVWANTKALPGQIYDKTKKVGWDMMPWLVAGGVAVVAGTIGYLAVQRWIVKSGTSAAMRQRPQVIVPPGIPAQQFQ